MKQTATQNKKWQLRILYVSLGVCIALMAAFAVMIVLELRTTGQGRAFYATLSVPVLPRSTAPPIMPRPAVPLAQPAFPPDADVYAPGPGEAHVSFVDFDEKRRQFSNVVAWIQSEGTVINYPVVQGSDNEFYLYHLADGTRHPMGSIFLDYRNAADFSCPVILIFGHDMRSGDMFGSLRGYGRQDYFEQHPSMSIFSPYQDFELWLIAGFVINSAIEIPPMSFADEGEFYQYIASIRHRSQFVSNIEVSYGDRLVILATCTPIGPSTYRKLVVGTLVPRVMAITE